MMQIRFLICCVLAFANATLRGENVFNDPIPPLIGRYGQTGLFETQSARSLGAGNLHVTSHGSYTSDPAYLVDPYFWDGTPNPYNPDFHRYTLHGGLSFGITHFLDISAILPAYFDHVVQHHLNINGVKDFGGIEGGFGDAEIAVKLRYPSSKDPRFFEMAYFGAVSVPSGNRSRGYFPRKAYYMPKDEAFGTWYYSSGMPELDMKMLWSLDISQAHSSVPLLFHLNYGIRFTGHERFDHIFLLNSGVEYHPSSWIALFTEVSGAARMRNIDNGFNVRNDPLHISPGITFRPDIDFFLTLGGSVSLASSSPLTFQKSGKAIQVLVEPRWELAATLGWKLALRPPDTDRDGLVDDHDRCPRDAEDLDGYRDKDGCPDPDNDNDGIDDSRDECPLEAEDKDGYEDTDGCPDSDNDSDGIPDAADGCPGVAEDNDGFDDSDGCPDIDNDGDNIADSIDTCPLLREDRDGFEDNDGCPDIDNDGDAVPDSLDECPAVAGIPGNNGCPEKKVEEIKRGKLILQGVNFKTGSPELTFESFAILDNVYRSLREWKKVKIEIRGHTDAQGNAEYNRRLSFRRAQSVRSYLIARGIHPSRLRAVGIGEDEPIADNRTADGRALNRRVELFRID